MDAIDNVGDSEYPQWSDIEVKDMVKAAVEAERQRCITKIERLRSFGDEGNGLLKAVILLTDGGDNGQA